VGRPNARLARLECFASGNGAPTLEAMRAQITRLHEKSKIADI
jgi:hypothetical protein